MEVIQLPMEVTTDRNLLRVDRGGLIEIPARPERGRCQLEYLGHIADMKLLWKEERKIFSLSIS